MYRDDHYRDPALYDLEYASQHEDVMFYLGVASDLGGPILELGCGNGRIALPLARAGHEITGLDLCEPMLAAFRSRLAQEPAAVRDRVTIRRQDFLHLDGDRTYPLVLLPFNALHHCATHRDLLSLFEGVHRNLAPGGRFLIDCYLPDPALYRRDPNARYEERIFNHPTTGERLVSWERGWYDPRTQVHHVVYIYQHADGYEHEDQIDFRMYYPQELRALIDWGGFRIIDDAQDFSGTPVSPEALKWVLTLESTR